MYKPCTTGSIKGLPKGWKPTKGASRAGASKAGRMTVKYPPMKHVTANGK